jgi:HTH-like domain
VPCPCGVSVRVLSLAGRRAGTRCPDRGRCAARGEDQKDPQTFDGTYGSPRITAELRDAGQKVNHKRVERVMRTHRIVGVHLRNKVRTTVPEPSRQRVPDLLKRDFTAAHNQRYVGDITYLPVTLEETVSFS